MRRLTLASAVAAVALGAAGAALADAPVKVTLGPELAAKTSSYGPRDLQFITQWLDETVTRALNRRGAAPLARADLVIEDAVPNRPTFQQLGRYTTLSPGISIGLGGARIGGTVTTADGRTIPVKFAFFEQWMMNEIGATTWRDAQRAFDLFSDKLAKGDYPQQTRMLQASGNGKFGPRFQDRFE